MLNYQVIPLKSGQDNYIWLIHDEQHAIVIDPTEAKIVKAYLTKHDLNLQAILLTHGHADHIGGVKELNLSYQPEIIDNLKQQLFESQIIQIGTFPVFQVMLTPGHTAEHAVYLFDMKHLFCGDVLFSMGCGRVFTNDFDAAYASLRNIKALDPAIRCYPAHEYTANNLRFTSVLDKTPDYYTQFAKFVVMKLSSLQNSLPTLLSDELQYNLFLRCHDPLVWSLVAAASDEIIDSEFNCFVALRKLRNNFS